MLDFLRGSLVHKSAAEAVVECAGLGFLVHISQHTAAALPDRGEVRLLVHLHTSDSGPRLFGFAEEGERALFRLLQGVRGLGPTLALGLLSHEPADRLLGRIKSGDVEGLTRVKGIGRKTAERLLVELRDRLGKAIPAAAPETSQERAVTQALLHLGLSAAEAEDRARRVTARAAPDTPVEVLLREALRREASSAAS